MGTRPGRRPHRKEAQAILDLWKRDDAALLVPSLWLYEVGNILCLKRPEAAAEILHELRNLHLAEVPGFEISFETARVAIEFGLTFYDASYVALALSESAILITADRRMVRKLPEDYPVILLEDISRS